MKRIAIIALMAASTAACSTSARNAGPPVPPAPVTAPDSFLVSMTTSKGEIVMKAHRDWSPAAVDRFYALTKGDIWKDARFFRVVPGFVVQWGLTGDSAVDNLWKSRRTPDEPVKVSNVRGRVTFARGGPESRTLQVFINVADNKRLDDANAGGIVGYPPFAEVTEGMDIVDKLESKYGEQPTRMQGEISTKGWPWLDERFPGLDRILRTRVTKEWR